MSFERSLMKNIIFTFFLLIFPVFTFASPKNDLFLRTPKLNPFTNSPKIEDLDLFELTDSVFPRITPEDAGLIYQMLKVIDELFTEHDIPYWIDSGTALGAVRHKGLIPWDDDGDLVFFIEDQDRILALTDEFAKYGFVLRKHEILRLHPSKKKYHPFIDIAGYTLLSNNTLHFNDKNSRKTYPNFYWLPSEVEHLIRVPFGPISLNAPHTMKRYLRTVYGNDCLTKAVFQPPHSGKYSSTIRSKVKIVDFSSAKYKSVHPRIPLD